MSCLASYSDAREALLPPIQKAVLKELAMMVCEDSPKTAKVDPETLARYTGFLLSEVHYALHDLERLGFIQWPRDGRMIVVDPSRWPV